MDNVERVQGGGKEDEGGGVGLGSNRVRPRGRYGPNGGTPGGIFVSTPIPASGVGREKGSGAKGKGQGSLSGIWDTLFLGWRR